MGKAHKKTAAKKKSVAAAPAGVPVIDTNLAAQTAARMIGARAGGPRATPTKESSAFRQLKESLAKPNAAGIDNLLNSTGPSGDKRTSSQQEAMKQVGHNQTFGADVNRHNLPRRTGG